MIRVMVDVLRVGGLGQLNILTFPVIRIAHGRHNMANLSHAAVHRLANLVVTPTLLEHLDNPIALPFTKGDFPLLHVHRPQTPPTFV
jgi:hypothetical protein